MIQTIKYLTLKITFIEQKMKKIKTTSLEDLIDKHIGKLKTRKRNLFEKNLEIEILKSASK